MTLFGSPRGLERLGTASIPIAGVVSTALIAWETRVPSLPTPFEVPLGRALAEAKLGLPAIGVVAPARALCGPTGAGVSVARLAAGAWALVAVIALYTFVGRTTGSNPGATIDSETRERRRRGLASVLVLSTTPAWFLHERLFAEPIVAMASFAIVLSCLGLAAFDRSLSTSRRLVLASGAALAAAVGATSGGLVFVGFVPALAIAVAAPPRTRLAAVSLGLLAVLFGLAVFIATRTPEGALATYLLGRGTLGARAPLFDAPLARAAHALSPWTPLVIVAFGRRPARPAELTLVVAGILSVLAECARSALGRLPTFEAPIGTAAIAGAIAATIPSLDRAKRPSAMLGGALVIVAALVANDLRTDAGAILRAFGVPVDVGNGWHPEGAAKEVGRAAFVVAGAWATLFVLPRRWLPLRRGTLVLAAGVLVGCILRFHTYPKVLARLSPSELFDDWKERRRSGEPLAVLSGDAPTFAFGSGDTSIVPVRDPSVGIAWLLDSAHERRFFALPSESLSAANAAYRAVHRQNLPILAGRENLTMLATSRLLPDERSESPLDRIVLDRPPAGLRPLDANIDDRLTVVGWELTDVQHRAIDSASGPVHVRFVLRVGDRPDHSALEGHCSFVHVDHTPARFAAEHRALAYPPRFWKKGDLVVDDFTITLPAHFRSGSYALFYGFGVLPCADDRRLPVLSGPKDTHDRVRAGELHVR